MFGSNDDSGRSPGGIAGSRLTLSKRPNLSDVLIAVGTVVMAVVAVLAYVKVPLPDTSGPEPTPIPSVPESTMPTPTPLPPGTDAAVPGTTPTATPGGPAASGGDGNGGGTVGPTNGTPGCAVRPGYALLVEPAENPTAAALTKAIRSSEFGASTTWWSSDVVAGSELNAIFSGNGAILANRSLPETLILVRLAVEGGPKEVDGQTLSELAGVMDVAIVRGPCSRPTVRLVTGLKEKTLNHGMEYAVRALSDAFKDELIKLIRGEE